MKIINNNDFPFNPNNYKYFEKLKKAIENIESKEHFKFTLIVDNSDIHLYIGGQKIIVLTDLNSDTIDFEDLKEKASWIITTEEIKLKIIKKIERAYNKNENEK